VVTALLKTPSGSRRLDLFALKQEAGHNPRRLAAIRERLLDHARAGALFCPACGGPVQPQLGDLGPWRFVHAKPSSNCPLASSRVRDLTKHALADELTRRYGGRVKRLRIDVPLPTRHGQVLWTPVAAQVDGLERVYEIWEEDRETVEEAKWRTQTHEAAGREVLWVLLKTSPHSPVYAWLEREARPYWTAIQEYVDAR